MANEQLDYLGYLKIKQLTSCQELESARHGEPAHIEMLYIIVHQAYELWFKEILHELESVIAMFDADNVNEKNMGIAVARLRRITSIQRVLIEQINVLETMTPLEFLDFRNYLGTASGFQSFQFRLIENRMGLKRSQRINYFPGRDYDAEFSETHRRRLIASESEPNLLQVVAAWLERTPFLRFQGFSFVDAYRNAVRDMLEGEREAICANTGLPPDAKAFALQSVDATEQTIRDFLDAEKHAKLMEDGRRSLSHRAMLAALFIHLYRDEPILQPAFQLLETLIDIDEQFTIWRNRHAVMVHRMLGRKLGTGQSSGYEYLKRTAERYRIFTDLFNIATYLIPRSHIPPLPDDLKRDLGFYWTAHKA